MISAFPTARSAVLLINSLWYRSHTCISIRSSINKGVPEVLCYPETYQALHFWMPGLLLNLYSELSFTASLYKGQVSNPRISWVKQPSECCTSSLAILYQTFGILFSKFIFNLQNFIIKSLEFPGWVTDFVLQRCCHAAALCCFTSMHSPPSFPGIRVEQERWRGLMLHNCDRSSWLRSSTDNLERNTFQIFKLDECKLWHDYLKTKPIEHEIFRAPELPELVLLLWHGLPELKGLFWRLWGSSGSN